MPQKHGIVGTFHITTNAHGKIPWCIWPGVPEILIDNLVMTRNLHQAKLCAFCIMPDHVHLILYPGEKGLAKFMKSWKQNSSRDIGILYPRSSDSRVAAPDQIQFSGWQKGYYDELINDTRQRTAAMNYVMFNPLKHHLVENMDHWPWTSYHFQELVDPLDDWS